MHPLTEPLAAVVASTDAVPRLIRQFTALFLVTPEAAVWRVFDSDDSTGASRFAASADPRVTARVFMGSGPRPQIRVYLFKTGEARSITAERLLEQLSAAKEPAPAS